MLCSRSIPHIGGPMQIKYIYHMDPLKIPWHAVNKGYSRYSKKAFSQHLDF